MLTAVLLVIDGDALSLAGTDRFRLVVRELRWTPSVPDVRAIAMVTARTLTDFARTMARGVPVTVAFGVSRPDTEDTGPASPPGTAREIGAQRAGASEQSARISDPRPVDGMISFEAGGRRLITRLIAWEPVRYTS